jgi:hypothetical protein
MKPNTRERLLASIVTSWTGIPVRAGDYVKVFGWSTALPLSKEWATESLECLRELAPSIEGGLLIGSLDQRSRSLASISPDEFTAALGERNKLDSSMGGAHIRSRANGVGLLIDWVEDPDAPITTVAGTFSERWLESEEHVRSLKRFAARMTVAGRLEYLIAAHVSDEARKMRGSSGRGAAYRYESKPARGLPYVPWLLVLGPRYVDFFGKERLASLDAFEAWWPDGCFACTTSETPLDYGTPAVEQRETSIHSVLGEETFIEQREPERVASGPTFPSGYKERTPTPGGKVWDAYPAKDGVKVVERNRRV